jgi:hypothetical protein
VQQQVTQLQAASARPGAAVKAIGLQVDELTST